MEMGASNPGDEVGEFLDEPDLGNRDNLDALWLAVGDASNES
jgi:hypothetical protein